MSLFIRHDAKPEPEPGAIVKLNSNVEARKIDLACENIRLKLKSPLRAEDLIDQVIEIAALYGVCQLMLGAELPEFARKAWQVRIASVGALGAEVADKAKATIAIGTEPGFAYRFDQPEAAADPTPARRVIKRVYADTGTARNASRRAPIGQISDGGRRRMSMDEAAIIRAEFPALAKQIGETPAVVSLARKYGAANATIYNIVNGKTWVPGAKGYGGKAKLTADQVHAIRKYNADHVAKENRPLSWAELKELGEMYGVAAQTIYQVITNRAWRNT